MRLGITGHAYKKIRTGIIDFHGQITILELRKQGPWNVKTFTQHIKMKH